MIKNITLLRIGTRILQMALLIWLIQTIYFQIAEGWHWKATHPVEILLDTLFSAGIYVGWLFYFIAIINHSIDAIEDKAKAEKES